MSHELVFDGFGRPKPPNDVTIRMLLRVCDALVTHGWLPNQIILSVIVHFRQKEAFCLVLELVNVFTTLRTFFAGLRLYFASQANSRRIVTAVIAGLRLVPNAISHALVGLIQIVEVAYDAYRLVESVSSELAVQDVTGGLQLLLGCDDT